jgi:hypothetical protein
MPAFFEEAPLDLLYRPISCIASAAPIKRTVRTRTPKV